MPEVKREKGAEKVSITMQELILQNVDRSRADLRRWWHKLQHAEQISYPNRSGLYDLGARAVLDGHLTGVMEKRVTAVLNKNLHYEIGGKRIDEMEDVIQSAKFRLMMRKLWEKKAWGISGLEFLVGKEINFVEIPRKHIKPEQKVIAFEQNGFEGIDYTKEFLIHVVEDVEKFGLISKSIPYTILKSGDLSDLAQYIEMYGQPIRKGTYPGDSPDLKAELKTALKEAGGSLSVLTPEGTNIEIIGDHVTNGNGEAHDVLFRLCNNELSIMWLGNTETTGNDNGGSNSKSDTQSKQQKEIHKSDLLDMQDMLSDFDLQMIFKSYNLPVNPEKGKFVYEKEYDVAELKTRKDIDIAIAGKVPVDDDYFYDTYGIPKPKEYDKMKAEMEEERKIKLQPPAPAPPAAPVPKKKKEKMKPLSAEEQLTQWEKIRLKIADFFAPGH